MESKSVSIKHLIKFHKWNVYRVLASSRILLLITVPIILGVLSFNLPYRSPIGLISIGLSLLLYLTINISLVAFGLFNFYRYGRGIKIRKVIFIFLAFFLIYSLVYLSLYNINAYNFKKITLSDDKNKIDDYQNEQELRAEWWFGFRKYYDMLYFSNEVISGTSFTKYIPISDLAKLIIITQTILRYMLMGILLSKAI